MDDAHRHLDELLTATTNYRESLAAEIMQRVELLQGQLASMTEAAAVLAGRPLVVEEAPPPNDEVLRQLAAEEQKTARLVAEVKNLREKASQQEPLDGRLKEMKDEVQESRDLAAKREKELQAALEEVNRLEERLRESQAARPEPTAVPDEGEFIATMKLRNAGPRGAATRPTFSVPKEGSLARRIEAHMGEDFNVYLLKDDSVLYRPTGQGVAEAAQEERQPPREEVVTPEGTYGLARSPKPIAEMRPNEAEKEQRLQGLVQHLIDNHSRGTFNGPDLAEDTGGDKVTMSGDLRVLESRGVLVRTGQFEFPRAVAEARRLNPKGGGGRPAIQYRLDEVLRKPPDDAQRLVRDFIVGLKGKMAGPRQIAEATELTREQVTEALAALVQRGSITSVGPSADMPLFAYGGPPKEAGRAAELDRQRSQQRTEVVPAEAVPGTGKGLKAANRDVQDLINAAQRAGARVKHESSGHFAVTVPGSGKRVLVASTPSNPRTVLNDRARLRRAGLNIAS